MSRPTRFRRAGRAGIAFAVCIASAAVPAAAQAAPVNLGTAGPFVVLGGSAVTNTGPSVLNGDLGVAPGTALSGFASPATVNGATHANDAVANQAQADLTTAYGVAAGQPVPPANDLTGTNLGNRTLTPGAYRYSSSAGLTGQLTLDAQGDPNAQFVFEIGSTLTTASASSVTLTNGASPCNVYWQVGSSATLGTTTAFQGSVMALSDISLNNGASVTGRMLARNGQITLINNVLDASACQASTTTTPPPVGTPPGGSGSTTPAGTPPGGSGATSPGATSPGATSPGGPGTGRRPTAKPPRRRTASVRRVTRKGTATMRRTPPEDCTAGFSAAVRGHLIKRVVFSIDGRRIGSRAGSPFQVFVRAAPGRHKVTARVTFKDATRAKTMTFDYRACAAAVLRPPPGPSRFTG